MTMSKTFPVVVLLAGFAVLAVAEEPKQRHVAIDTVAAPDLGIRFPIQLSNEVSLRPGLGFGSSGLTGTFWNLGTELRYTFRPTGSRSLFVTGYAGYLRAENVPG